MIVPLIKEDGLVPLDLSRVEGLPPLAEVFEQRRAERSWSAFWHGRRFGRRYRHGRR